MAGPAAICIGAGRRRPLEISGLKVFSSLQGPAGELRTIYRETCVAAIATMIDIGNGIWPPRDPWHPSAAGCHRSQVDRTSAPRCRRPCTRRARQTSGAFRAHCRGKGKRARSACSHHAEQARHRRVKIDDALQILPVSPSDATRHPSLDFLGCLLYTSPSPRDTERSRMPSSA